MSSVIEHVAASRHRTPRRRVPTVTPSFWVAAVLGTAFAEAVVSWLTRETRTSLGLLAVGITLTLGVAAGLKLRAGRGTAVFYWAVFVIVDVAGVLYAKVLTDVLAAPLPTVVMVLALLLIAVLGAWRADEGTVSQASVTTSSRELTYWSAWLTTAALGATVGEWLLVGVQWEPASMVSMGLALVVVVFTGRLIGAGAVLCFWVGAVAIRPLGASVADWLASSSAHGGAGFGAGVASLLCMAGFVSAIAFSTERSSRSGDETAVSDGIVFGVRWSARQYRQAGFLVATATGVAILALLLMGPSSQTAATHSGLASAYSAAASTTADAGRATESFSEVTVANYRSLTRDALTMVNARRPTAAQAQVATLQTQWTADQTTLRALDPAGWALLDSRIADVAAAMPTADHAIDRQTVALTSLLNALR